MAKKQIERCAKCGSENITYGNTSVIREGRLVDEYQCDDCDHLGEEIYNIVYSHST